MSLRSLVDVPAPAKLNLFLHVVGRRDDGYHLLQSLFALIDWADTLHFERRDDGALTRRDLGPALPPEDLTLRAARLLKSKSGARWGADISVLKSVPWGAGMGGGSSDAATTLLALNRLWGLNWPRERLMALGLDLGADVPFFIGGDNAFVEGVGEKLTPVSLSAQRYAVLKPPAALDTGAVFASPELVRSPDAAIISGLLANKAQLAAWTADKARNDLQAAAQALCPEVAQAAQWLGRRFGNSRMTGSGSAVFARVGDEPERTGAEFAGLATAPQAAWPAENEIPPGWVGRSCQGLRQHPLRGWASD